MTITKITTWCAALTLAIAANTAASDLSLMNSPVAQSTSFADVAPNTAQAQSRNAVTLTLVTNNERPIQTRRIVKREPIARSTTITRATDSNKFVVAPENDGGLIRVIRPGKTSDKMPNLFQN